MQTMPLALICLATFLFQNICAVCEIEMVSRDTWGARAPRDTQLMNMPVPHIFIHHTATSSCTSLNSCSQKIRSIQNYHMDNKNWSDIGYNFLIGGDGRVYIGRGWDKIGAHTYGFNHNAVAFSLMGNYTNSAPSENMLQTTIKMTQCAKDQGYVTNCFKVHGHRDGSCTDCPGQTLYDIIKTWDNFEQGPLPGFSCSSN